MNGTYAALALAMVVGCATEKRSETAPPPPPDGACSDDGGCGAYEICDEGTCLLGDRDDDFDGATPILLDDPQDAIIQDEGDIDTWVYTALGPEWIRVQTTTIGDRTANLDTAVRIFRSNGAEHAQMNDFAIIPVAQYDTVLHAYLPEAGDYYITVEDVWTFFGWDEERWRGDEDFTYTLEVLEFDGVVVEPDAAGSSVATSVTRGTTTTSVGVVIEDTTDIDHLDIAVSFTAGPLEIWGQSSIPGSTLRAVVDLYDEADQLVAHKEDLGFEGRLSLYAPTQQTYRAEVSDLAGVGGPSAWAMLYVRSWEPDANHPFFAGNVVTDEVEPNDTRAQSTSVPAEHVVPSSGSEYDRHWLGGTFGAPADVDVFRLAALAGDLLSVRCYTDAYGSLATLRAQLVDPAGGDITPLDQGTEPTASNFIVYNVPAPVEGDYDVILENTSAVSGAGAYYWCILYRTLEELDPS